MRDEIQKPHTRTRRRQCSPMDFLQYVRIGVSGNGSFVGVGGCRNGNCSGGHRGRMGPHGPSARCSFDIHSS